MAKCIGIAMDLEVRKWELEQKYKNTRGWLSTTSFDSRAEAAEWAKKKSEELKCKVVAPGKAAKNPKLKWHGFLFEHDGPK